MDAAQKLIARKMFRLRVHEAKGDAYQELFEKVMQYRFPGFVPIKPYGNIGDRKNDGYLPATGIYFQVYAPEDPTTSRTAAIAAAKAHEDFTELLIQWNSDTEVKAFRFVFNDAYRGSPPPVQAALAAIQKTHAVDAGVFLAKDLENEALELPEDQLIDVINAPIPRPDTLPDVDFGVLREVINHVLAIRTPLIPSGRLNAPDFDIKMKFNGLTTSVASLLVFGSYQSDAVADYFSTNSSFARQSVRDELAAIYAESRRQLEPTAVSGSESHGDLVYFDLLNKTTPDVTVRDSRVAAQQAAMIVLAYYFEACDIFEDPNAAA